MRRQKRCVKERIRYVRGQKRYVGGGEDVLEGRKDMFFWWAEKICVRVRVNHFRCVGMCE